MRHRGALQLLLLVAAADESLLRATIELDGAGPGSWTLPVPHSAKRTFTVGRKEEAADVAVISADCYFRESDWSLLHPWDVSRSPRYCVSCQLGDPELGESTKTGPRQGVRPDRPEVEALLWKHKLLAEAAGRRRLSLLWSPVKRVEGKSGIHILLLRLFLRHLRRYCKRALYGRLPRGGRRPRRLQ